MIPSGKKWDGKYRGSPLGNRIFILLIRVLGPFPSYVFMSMIICYYSLFVRTGAQGIRQFRDRLNLPWNGFFTLFCHYYSFGIALVDRISFLKLKKPPFRYAYINERYITEALDRKKGAILLSAHLGNWEIAGNLLNNRIDTPINLVMLDNVQRNIKDMFSGVTGLRRIGIIPITGDAIDTMIRIRNVLSRNELVCFHGDRVLGQSGVLRPFFGADAEFPQGPFQIAAITGVPIVPFFAIKTGLNHYTFRAFSPIPFNDISRRNRAQAIRTAQDSYIHILEEMTRSYPYQWYNFFEFWNN